MQSGIMEKTSHAKCNHGKKLKAELNIYEQRI
jgi:hypothetical protein